MVSNATIELMKKKLEATRLDVAIGESELRVYSLHNDIAIVEEQLVNLKKRKEEVNVQIKEMG